MIGQGHLQEKLTKIAILAKKSQQYNDRFDELERTGLPLKAIPVTIAQEEKSRNEATIDVLPFDESRKVIEVGSVLSLGFEKAHTVKSEAKNMNETIHNKFQRTKDLKVSQANALKQGIPIEEDHEEGNNKRFLIKVENILYI